MSGGGRQGRRSGEEESAEDGVGAAVRARSDQLLPGGRDLSKNRVLGTGRPACVIQRGGGTAFDGPDREPGEQPGQEYGDRTAQDP
jgi:hypothetical protein